MYTDKYKGYIISVVFENVDLNILRIYNMKMVVLSDYTLPSYFLAIIFCAGRED